MDGPSTDRPVTEATHSLAAHIKQSVKQLREYQPEGKGSKDDSILFIGSWQDAIPRAIWTDPTLEAIDVRIWGFIRTCAASNSATTFPSYNLIATQLNVARATVSRAIQILRACRWLTLCSCIRDPRGQFRGNVYALHDEPITLHDGLYLDPHYLRFIQELESHHHQRVSRIAKAVLTTLREQIENNEDMLKEIGKVSRFNAIAHGQPFVISNHQVQYLNSDKTLKSDPVQNLNSANQNNNNQSLNVQVQKLNSATCSSSFIKKSTTTSSNTSPRAFDALAFPKTLNHDERELAFLYLQTLPQSDQQALLDELAAQIQSKKNTTNPIRNPIGYLSWMCGQLETGKRPLTSLGLNNKQHREREHCQELQLDQVKKQMTEQARTTSTNTPLGHRLDQLADRIARKKDT